MKKTVITLAAATLFVCGSCAKKAEAETADAVEAPTTQAHAAPAHAPATDSPIVGTWRLSDIDMGIEVPKAKEKQFEEMKAKMLAKVSYTFNADGTMAMTTPMFDKEMTGTYTLDGAKLTLTSGAKKPETINVDSLTADRLVLSTEQGGKKMVMAFSK